MTWPLDPSAGVPPATTAAQPLEIGDRVAYHGPGTKPDTGIIYDIVRQANADDLLVVAWDSDPADRDLYHPGRLRRVR